MNPYETLGVDKNTSVDDIKKAYRKLSKQHHPDLGGDENKFKDIAAAYEILSNPEKKQQYDTFGNGNPFGNSAGNPFGGSGGFEGFDDFISQMFGGSSRRQRTKKGNDLQVVVQVTLNEVVTGVSKKITYQRNDKCQPCNGVGGEESTKCTNCQGSGEIVRNIQTSFGMMQQASPCLNCESTGFVVKNKCNTCRGAGVTPKVETIEVNIPAGVSNGMHLTMQGGGNVMKNGINGDLLIRIDEIRDPNFIREGNNLTHDIWISISDAVLGTSKNIKSPTGEFNFKISEGCDSGKIFNFNGKGVPNLSPDGRNFGSGNLYVRVNITIPKQINDEAKALFEDLKKYENA